MSEPTGNPPDPLHSHRPSPEVIREFDDRGTQWVLEDPENLRGVLQILEPALADHLDFARAVRVNRTFVPADLRKRESDIVFRVPFIGDQGGARREVWVFILLEHQSEPDPLMALRLYLYMGQLWDLQRREWEDAHRPVAQLRLYPVIPLVFYTGEERWSAPIDLASLMDLPAEAERFVPSWETLFLPLHQTTPEMLTRFATAIGWALRALQAERAPLAEMERVLAEAMAGLEGLPDEQAGRWLRVAWFFVLLVLHRRKERELMDVLLEKARESKFAEKGEVAEADLTLWQQMERRAQAQAEAAVQAELARVQAELARVRAETEARVRAETEAQTLRGALTRVLAARFGALPAEAEAAVAAADVATLNVWLDRAAGAPTLEAVGIRPGPASAEE